MQALGGWGNVPPPVPLPEGFDPAEWELEKESDDAELQIRWKHFVALEPMEEDSNGWGASASLSSWEVPVTTGLSRAGGEEEMDTGGW